MLVFETPCKHVCLQLYTDVIHVCL